MNKIAKSTAQWRDSAALILLTKHNNEFNRSNNKVNYNILFQTRSHNASFPNSVVFPGGVTEAADADVSWLSLFKDFGYTQKDFDSFYKVGSPTPILFQNNPVHRHISLRITAIRETFEELGVLLCCREHKTNKTGNTADVFTELDVQEWQKRISESPGELLNFCREYKCYPDIWSLHYWSNWMTPLSHAKRFDAAFFISAIKETQQTSNSSEVVHAQYASPHEILEKASKAEIDVNPPQWYELHRLSQVPDMDQLISLAKERSPQAEPQIYPVRYNAKDGVGSILPGDDLYPANVDLLADETVHTDETLEQLRDRCNKLHRFEFSPVYHRLITRNHEHPIENIDKIVPPILTNKLDAKK